MDEDDQSIVYPYQTIDRLYFEDEENFNLDYLINELPTDLTSVYLLDYKSRLEKLLTDVTRKVSELILSHQPTYVDELQRIANLQKSITDSIRVCTQGRSCLRFIKEGTVKNGSVIIEHYRKRESLARLLESLQAISALKSSVSQIRTLIEKQQDFPQAIQLCKDGKSMLASFQKYTCVKELGSKLNDTIELIGEQVDTAIAKMCLSYDPGTYSMLQTSYVMMDRSEIAVDQLLMHFCSAINSHAHIVVIKSIESATETARGDEQKSDQDRTNLLSSPRLKKDFQDLCKMLSCENYLDCLVELCTTFWFMMMNYKRILKWHEVDIKTGSDDTPELGSSDLISDRLGEDFKKSYVEQKLVSGLNRLWYDMKRKLSTLILNHDFSGYRFDEFIKILEVVELVMRMGDEFCGCPSSDDLQQSIDTQALNFFNAYHKSSMDELKMFLDNELWEILPVKDDFKLVQLREFSFLRTEASKPSDRLSNIKISNCGHNDNYEFFTREIIEDLSVNYNPDNKRLSASISNDYSMNVTSVIPFDNLLNTTKDTGEDLFRSSGAYGSYLDNEEPLPLDKISLSSDSEAAESVDEDINSELNKDFVDENDTVNLDDEQVVGGTSLNRADPVAKQPDVAKRYSLTKTSGPVLTNSSLNVLRLFGRYIKMMSVLESISYEILMRIYNLLDHYTFVVYKKFGPDSEEKSEDVNAKLRAVVRSIRESLIGGSQSDLDNQAGHQSLVLQQGAPNIQQIITHDLLNTNAQSSQAANDVNISRQKAVAIESLITLVNQLWNLQEYLESLIPSEMRPQLKDQFVQNNSIVPEFLKARAELTFGASHKEH